MSDRQIKYNTDSREALEYYLDSLFPASSGWIELRPFSDQKDLFPTAWNARRWYPDVQTLLAKLPVIYNYLKNKRNGAFIGVCPRIESGVGSKEHVDTGYAVWSDIDDKDTGSRASTLKHVEQLLLPPSCVVESGGGVHVYYFLSEPAGGAEIEAANKLLIAVTNGDNAASDCSRILRLPHSYHCKSDPKMVQFLELNSKKYTLQEVVNSLGGSNLFNLELEKEKKKNPIKKIKHLPKGALSPAVEELLQKYPRIEALYNGIGKEHGGQSPSEYDYAFVKELLWYGACTQDTVNALQMRITADGRTKPPHYIQRTVGKAAADVERRKGGKKLEIVSHETSTAPSIDLERYPEDYSNKMLRGRPLSSLVNLLKILRYRASATDRPIRYNEFKHQIELYGSRIEDYKCIKLMEAIFTQYRQEWSLDIFSRALEATAREFTYHPVQEHIEKCYQKWLQDGSQSRIHTVLYKYCRAKTSFTDDTGEEMDITALLEGMSKCFFIGGVARIYKAGCKLDSSLILANKEQGTGKSTFFKLLASNADYKNVKELLDDSPTWFCDSALDPSAGRDTFSKLTGVWIYEFAEMEATRKKDATLIKAFLSSAMDKYSPKYARYDVEQKRSVVFAGTSNELEILREKESRRHHIVETGVIDLEGLLKIRDLLWGEAYHLYKIKKQKWNLDKPLEQQLKKIQSKYAGSDSWEEAILRWLNDPQDRTIRERLHTTEEILKNAIRMDTEKHNRAVIMRLAGILSATGWKKKRASVGGRRIWKWQPPQQEV